MKDDPPGMKNVQIEQDEEEVDKCSRSNDCRKKPAKKSETIESVRLLCKYANRTQKNVVSFFHFACWRETIISCLMKFGLREGVKKMDIF